MEYYNTTSTRYYQIVKQPLRKMKLKMEILTHGEYVIGELVNDISQSNVGTISANRQQGCRRSCSFSIIDKDKKYIPTPDSIFWQRRKFKLYIGVCDNEDIYWFSQGVFITKDANANGDIITINGVDKYGLLNGELGTGMCMVDTKSTVTLNSNGKYVKNSVYIVDLIRQTLTMDMGDGQPFDPITPVIDPAFCDEQLSEDVIINKGEYIGGLLDRIAEMYGAFIYYDVDGRLRMERIFNNFIPSYYRHLYPKYSFNEINLSKTALQVAYSYDGFNIVTVSTDNTSGRVYTYTAKNKNPKSPVCVQAVGERGYTGAEIKIALGDTTINVNGEEKCRQYAEHLLLQNVCMKVQVDFSYPILHDLDVDNNVRITNKSMNFDDELFLVQSLSIPIGAKDMDISVVNHQWAGINTLS